MTEVLLFLAIGLCAGVLSGLLGIGGGIIIVPALFYILGFSQHQAQGTTLALMVPPIGFLAALEYYRRGHADLRAALLICLGFFIGGFLGARLAHQIPGPLLTRFFGLMMLGVAVRMVFF